MLLKKRALTRRSYCTGVFSNTDSALPRHFFTAAGSLLALGSKTSRAYRAH